MTVAVGSLALSVLLGSCFAAGVMLMVALWPYWGRASLSRRIAPYLQDVADHHGRDISVLLPERSRRWREATRLLSRLGDSDLVLRLHQAGWGLTVSAFRSRQLLWAVLGGAIGIILAIAGVIGGRPFIVMAFIPVVSAASAVVMCEMWLRRAAARRIAAIKQELPTVLDFLALCLAAGEGLRDALIRVSSGSGELPRALQTMMVAVNTGSSITDGLRDLSSHTSVPTLTRTIDYLVAAIDQGAPLAQVLKNQAEDAREEAKRELMERAGRKEIAMLLPLVFLILPLSVLFAVFPGVFLLRLGIV